MKEKLVTVAKWMAIIGGWLTAAAAWLTGVLG